MADVNRTRFTRREAIHIFGAAGVAYGTGGVPGEPVRFRAGRGLVDRRNPIPKITFPKGAIVRTVVEGHRSARCWPPAPPPGTSTWPFRTPVRRCRRTPGQSGTAPLADSLELISDELRQAAFDGLAAIVDANASGRSARTDEQIDFLKQVATRAPKVHILVAGGPFKSPYSPEVVKQSVDELTEQLVRDSTTQRWGAMGEIGTSMQMTADERKVLTAIAKAHVRTGSRSSRTPNTRAARSVRSISWISSNRQGSI